MGAESTFTLSSRRPKETFGHSGAVVGKSNTIIKYLCINTLDQLSYRTKFGLRAPFLIENTCIQVNMQLCVCVLFFCCKNTVVVVWGYSPSHSSQKGEAFSNVREKPSLFREVIREAIYFLVTVTFSSENTHNISF